MVDAPRTLGFSISHATGFALSRVALRDDPDLLSDGDVRDELEVALAEVTRFRCTRGRSNVDKAVPSLPEAAVEGLRGRFLACFAGKGFSFSPLLPD